MIKDDLLSPLLCWFDHWQGRVTWNNYENGTKNRISFFIIELSNDVMWNTIYGKLYEQKEDNVNYPCKWVLSFKYISRRLKPLFVEMPEPRNNSSRSNRVVWFAWILLNSCLYPWNNSIWLYQCNWHKICLMHKNYI